jgi:hypothetical protein
MRARFAVPPIALASSNTKFWRRSKRDSAIEKLNAISSESRPRAAAVSVPKSSPRASAARLRRPIQIAELRGAGDQDDGRGIKINRADHRNASVCSTSDRIRVSAARAWALNLIDANADGVKFSKEARAELLEKALDTIMDPNAPKIQTDALPSSGIGSRDISAPFLPSGKHIRAERRARHPASSLLPIQTETLPKFGSA